MTDLQNQPAQQGRVEAPASVTEMSSLLRDTTGSVLVRGGATKLDWAGRVTEPDLVLDTSRLTGVLTYNPADLTASVRAGTRLDTLQTHLMANQQWLALDPPSASRGATVGGLLAAGDSGPSRLRYGGLRDLVIGVTLVLADGTVARSGGHVIKNVAGYDLAKLMNGSLGSLAVLAEVVVRLHPRPASSFTTAGEANADQATEATQALAASPLEPAAVEWVSSSGRAGDPGRLLVRLDGTEKYVSEAAGRVQALLSSLGVSSEALGPETAAQVWQEHREAVLGVDDETAVRICGLPSGLAAVARDAHELADQAQLGVQVISSAALGIHTVRLRGGTPAAHARTVVTLRGRALVQGASVLLCGRPPAFDEYADALGPEPSSVQLLRRIKSQFDPAGRLAPGRFHPWY